MRVVEEPISVLRGSGEQRVTLLMGGYRIALTVEEARALVNSVRGALSSDGGMAEPPAAGAHATDPAAIVAKVTEQVISWAQIADATQRK